MVNGSLGLWLRLGPEWHLLRRDWTLCSKLYRRHSGFHSEHNCESYVVSPWKKENWFKSLYLLLTCFCISARDFDSETCNYANLYDLKLRTRADPTSHNVFRVLGSAQNTAMFLTAGFTKFFEIKIKTLSYKNCYLNLCRYNTISKRFNLINNEDWSRDDTLQVSLKTHVITEHGLTCDMHG